MAWPSSPTNGQQTTINGVTYQYVSATGVWDRVLSNIATNVGVSGTNTQVQFNDGGTSFGAAAGLTFNKTSNILSVTGGVNAAGQSTFTTLSDYFSTISGATGTVTHDMSTGAVFYHTSPAANFIPNFTNVSTTDNYCTVAALVIVNTSPAYLPIGSANVQVNGSNVAIKWVNGSSPIPTTNAVTVASFNLVRSSGAWTVLGQTSFYS